jgi:hypothetical protein
MKEGFMADNVAITAGSGTTVSTEEVTNLNAGAVSAQHVQRMLAAIRTRDGYAIDLSGDASNGLDVDVTRLPALAAGSAEIGGVNVMKLAGTAVDTNSGSKSAGTQRVVLATDQPALTAALRVDGSGVTQPVSDGGGSLTVDGTVVLGAGSAAIGMVDPRGNVAHDGADAGNPIKVGGRARTALPAAVTQDDRADMVTDKFGRTVMVAVPLDALRSGTQNFTGTSAADVIAAPGASLAIVVTEVLVINAHATVGTKVTIRDGTTVKIPGFAGANGGGFNPKNPFGLFVAATNTAVTAICGTTGADVDVTVFGYTIPA